MALSRRGWIVGATSALAGPAFGAPGPALTKHPAFRLWEKPRKPTKLPMGASVSELSGSNQTLGQWFGGKAAVLVYWATWCGPCLAESPDLARLERKLRATGANTAIRPLHAFDEATLAVGRATLNRIGARDLEAIQASPALEATAISIFGRSPVEKTRTSIPALLLATADGTVIGTRLGTVEPEKGRLLYWDDPSTLDFLTQLGRA